MSFPLLIGATVLCASSLLAQAKSPANCAENKKRLAELATTAKSMSDADQLKAYLNFLKSVADDPEDCVTSDTRSAIGRAERKLIALKVGDRSYSPAKALHCNQIDKPSQVCRGPELDDTPLSGEPALTTPAVTLPASGRATLDVAKVPGARVIGVFAQERVSLQDGKAPVQLPLQGRSFSLQALHKYQHPVLIVLLRSDRPLRYLKCVWLF